MARQFEWAKQRKRLFDPWELGWCGGVGGRCVVRASNDNNGRSYLKLKVCVACVILILVQLQRETPLANVFIPLRCRCEMRSLCFANQVE